jgi:hypothetical protein
VAGGDIRLTKAKSHFSVAREYMNMSEDDVEHTLRVMISWGRYAEAFEHADEHASYSLENPS